MRKNTFSNLILMLIYKSGGKWSWYQIERALDLRGIGGIINPVNIINNLIKEGFIKEEVSTQDMPNYIIKYIVTEQGKHKAEELIAEYGVEAFAPTHQNPNNFNLR